jgi:hypothetical protein
MIEQQIEYLIGRPARAFWRVARTTPRISVTPENSKTFTSPAPSDNHPTSAGPTTCPSANVEVKNTMPVGHCAGAGLCRTSAVVYVTAHEALNGKVVEWMDKVADAKYLAGPLVEFLASLCCNRKQFLRSALKQLFE